MNADSLVSGGWVSFAAVILAAVGLIAAAAMIAHMAGLRPRVLDGRVRPFGDAAWPFTGFFTMWAMLHLVAPDRMMVSAPFAAVVPGIDLVLAAAGLVMWLSAVGRAFQPDWTWRIGLSAFLLALWPAIGAFMIYDDIKTVPAGMWSLAVVEAVILLPFALRLGYRIVLKADVDSRNSSV